MPHIPHTQSPAPSPSPSGSGSRPSRRSVLAGAAAAGTAALLGTAAGPAQAAAEPKVSRHTHIFYYPWYGNPQFYGQWRHWPQGSLTPPDDISSNYYPVLGPYDSGDLHGAVAQHMRWLRRAGTGVLVSSWWGQGSYEDQQAEVVLEAAAAEGIQVAWHIEPYGGRTADSVVADIRYLTAKYGDHPAFHRDPERGDRTAYYVFNSLLTVDWSALHQVDDQAIVMAQTWDESRIGDFGGVYTYDAIATANKPDWTGVAAFCADRGMVWAPSLGPGYIDDRAVPGNTTPTLDRANGATYDQEWDYALSSGNGDAPPDWVSITSFNEWHEGTMIEPATATTPGSLPYLNFEGAYGRRGKRAETAYLDRTAWWAARFEAARAAGRWPLRHH
ncbi:glycoside hydrolase family 99 protein [Actinacidiphila acididurans]|uniref:Alpha-mannosidase n=1 Tax=Actinacidiphila acididurans TaxID=2784346 RepID=A0ABS2TV68_9ACTN|nr:glycoside hydrolase family 99 protein [Actinacidiphila acididurans]MBM9507231.1 alpha-mannosidase [Actinacidiphila acididurans]